MTGDRPNAARAPGQPEDARATAAGSARRAATGSGGSRDMPPGRDAGGRGRTDREGRGNDRAGGDPGARARHDARDLTGGAPTAAIILDGACYTLRITRSGKLLLTK
ncbi:MAG: hypothetical protein Kow0058_05240 [Roseovarius sp.]